MRIYLIVIVVLVCLVVRVYAYSEEEILAALQKKIELLDPDSEPYLTEQDKKNINDFLKKNERLFASLGSKETLFYIKLVTINSNPNITPSIARYAVEAYKKNYDQYNIKEKNEIEQQFDIMKVKRYLSEKNIKDIEKLKSKEK